MARGNETFGKKEVRAKKDKKRKEKEKKRLDRKDQGRDGNNLDEMIAYTDEFGNISSTPPDLSQKKAVKLEDIEIATPRNVVNEDDSPIRKGIVTFFNQSKGFGFIKDSVTQNDVFVHINSTLEAIQENNKVTFEVSRGPKGLTAVNVKIDRE